MTLNLLSMPNWSQKKGKKGERRKKGESNTSDESYCFASVALSSLKGEEKERSPTTLTSFGIRTFVNLESKEKKRKKVQKKRKKTVQNRVRRLPRQPCDLQGKRERGGTEGDERNLS